MSLVGGFFPGAFFGFLSSVTLKLVYMYASVYLRRSEQWLKYFHQFCFTFATWFHTARLILICVSQTVVLVCLCRCCMTQQCMRPGLAITLKFNSNLICSYWCNRRDLYPICLPQDVFCLGFWGETTFIWHLMMNAIDHDASCLDSGSPGCTMIHQNSTTMAVVFAGSHETVWSDSSSDTWWICTVLGEATTWALV